MVYSPHSMKKCWRPFHSPRYPNSTSGYESSKRGGTPSSGKTRLCVKILRGDDGYICSSMCIWPEAFMKVNKNIARYIHIYVTQSQIYTYVWLIEYLNRQPGQRGSEPHRARTYIYAYILLLDMRGEVPHFALLGGDGGIRPLFC